MPKISIKVQVWSKEGFSETVYSNETIIETKPKYFTKPALVRAISFIKKCMDEFNKGERGNRWFGSKEDKR